MTLVKLNLFQVRSLLNSFLFYPVVDFYFKPLKTNTGTLLLNKLIALHNFNISQLISKSY